ncbi:MAG: hypothetical protein GY870_11095 [archaeon]|nr:hypothetical protein [archaeon]
MPVSRSESSLDINRPKKLVINKILNILEYQFNKPILNKFLMDEMNVEIEFSKKTGKMKYIFFKGERLLSYKSNVGLFSFSQYAAKLLHKSSIFPDFRVKVMSEIEDFIIEGKSVFSKHVLDIDKNLRIGNDVLVVNEKDDLIGVGKLLIPPLLYHGIPTGVAVSVRKGINNKNTKKI